MDGKTFESQILLTEENYDKLCLISDSVKAAGAAISIQLTHGGSFADRTISNLVQMAPSSLFNPAGFNWPKEMNEEDMLRVVTDFATAAALCKKALYLLIILSFCT